ncbi:MAG: glycosyl transferase [Gemmatimonadota bacterium]
MGPYAQLLSNGRYRVLLTGAGAGASSFESVALTRWAADRTRDADGFFLYIRDLDRGHLWGAGRQPVGRVPDIYRTRSGPGRAEILREDDGIVTRLDVCVDPDADAEIRLLTLTNRSRKPRHLDVTSYAEVALNSPAADAAHPAFSKLFVQTEYFGGREALLARRRPRSPDELPVYLGHRLAIDSHAAGEAPSVETDRARFIGRGRTLANPAVLDAGAALSGTTGNVLDPILAMRREVHLTAGESIRLVAILAAGRDRDAVTACLTSSYTARAPEIFHAARARDLAQLKQAGLPREWRERLPLLMGAVSYGAPLISPGAAFPEPSTLVLGDSKALGLVGGIPLMVARVAAPPTAHAVLQLARVATYWRAAGFAVDLLIVDDLSSEELRTGLPTSVGAGRTVVRRSTEIPAELHNLVERAARLTMLGAPPEVRNYVGDTPAEKFRPASPERGDAPLDTSEQLLDNNSYGGFSPDGTEYVIRLPREKGELRRPPLAWSNIIANEEIGFLTTDSGAGYTWSVNSRENRLTPWSNDPVTDPHGEALYLRDEDSGLYWSPLPGPVPGAGGYEVRHGFGYSRTLHESQQLGQEVVSFVPRHDGVKLVRLRITNRSARARHLSAFGYCEWVLGVVPSDTTRFVVTERDAATGALLAMNPHNAEFSSRIAFAAMVGPDGSMAQEYSADRGSFLGRLGSTSRPDTILTGEPLDGHTGAGFDPCAAFRVSMTLAPGASAECTFLLGEAATREDARIIVRRYEKSASITAALDGIVTSWRETLGRVQVRTPSPAIDLMLNGWLSYQNLCCRMWARSAFYQSGGAFGFRDQLQDAAALIYLDPTVTREQILKHAAHQFVEGDVLHWWHPPLSKGIRTRFSDDLLWLPYITAGYIRHTGDLGILDERTRFLTARALEPGEDEEFMVPQDSGESADLYEHCCRVLDRSLTRGAHGLPLMGTGDWNDGMNRVGREGRGESVWLGFFLFHILDGFLPLCDLRDDANRATRYRAYQRVLGAALNSGGWDGEWYRRAYYDNGDPIGSKESDECRIDAIAQAWAVLSGAAPQERAALALDALERYLVSEEDGIIRLLTPAFDKTPNDPGYIKGYLPGVRENGGQYTHGALWAVRALAEAGRGERAATLLEMLSPVNHGRTSEEVARYQVEPYVIAADVYGVAPHLGRGGWTWYTGSAGWMFRVALESVLGMTMSGGDTLLLSPCIPESWPGFSMRYRLPNDSTTYEIDVLRGGGEYTTGTLDGMPLSIEGRALVVPLKQDGQQHRIEVTLGADVGPRYASRLIGQ